MSIKELLNEILLKDKTFIHLPFGNGKFDIYESVVVTWIIMAVILVVLLILTRDFKVHNISKRQAAVETFVGWLREIVGGMLGEEGETNRRRSRRDECVGSRQADAQPEAVFHLLVVAVERTLHAVAGSW